MRDATTPPRAGEVSVGRRGDIHRRDLHHTPSATLVPLKEGQLWIQLLLNWGTVMRNARRSCIKIHFPSADDADNADFSSLYYTEWLLFICAICVICGRKIKEAFLTHPPTETRKFSLTVCVPVAAELLNF